MKISQGIGLLGILHFNKVFQWFFWMRRRWVLLLYFTRIVWCANDKRSHTFGCSLCGWSRRLRPATSRKKCFGEPFQGFSPRHQQIVPSSRSSHQRYPILLPALTSSFCRGDRKFFFILNFKLLWNAQTLFDVLICCKKYFWYSFEVIWINSYFWMWHDGW